MKKPIPFTLRRSFFAGLSVTVFWIFSYFGARFVLDGFTLTPEVRVIVAFLPVLPMGLFLWFVVANIRSLDELQRRIHLEALVVAFPLSILLLSTLGLLQLAINLSMDDWSYRHVWVYLPLFYFIGLAIAWRRY